jgi:hypothetical protein
MATLILKAGKFAKVGSIVLQAITLVVGITETIVKSKESRQTATPDETDKQQD